MIARGGRTVAGSIDRTPALGDFACELRSDVAGLVGLGGRPESRAAAGGRIHPFRVIGGVTAIRVRLGVIARHFPARPKQSVELPGMRGEHATPARPLVDRAPLMRFWPLQRLEAAMRCPSGQAPDDPASALACREPALVRT